MAVRRSFRFRRLRLRDADVAIGSTRAARAGSDPTTRTTCSTDDFGSDKIRLTRTAISGKDGRSTLATDSSAARVRTKSNAALDWACDVFVKLALTFHGGGHAGSPGPNQRDRPATTK